MSKFGDKMRNISHRQYEKEYLGYDTRHDIHWVGDEEFGTHTCCGIKLNKAMIDKVTPDGENATCSKCKRIFEVSQM